VTPLHLAEALLNHISPECERIEIAGSIRRGKPDPKDIELVAIPRFVTTPIFDLFQGEAGQQINNLLEIAIADLLEKGEWEFDPDVRRNGEKYKRLRHRTERNSTNQLIACDLFIVTPPTWGIQFTIRTGPGSFSQTLVTRALHLGMFIDGGLLHNHRREYKTDPHTAQKISMPCSRGDHCPLIIPTPEEQGFFTALGLPFIPPPERTIEQLKLCPPR